MYNFIYSIYHNTYYFRITIACVGTQLFFLKKSTEIFCSNKKIHYLCSVILKTIFLP